jgi:hypothetical protein
MTLSNNTPITIERPVTIDLMFHQFKSKYSINDYQAQYADSNTKMVGIGRWSTDHFQATIEK